MASGLVQAGSTNYNICVICQIEDSGGREYKNYTENPSEKSIRNVIEKAEDRLTNGDLKYKPFIFRPYKTLDF